MENFTPISSLIGGGLIGLSAVLFMLLNGRIAGISGIAGGLIVPVAGDWPWRLAFVLGLVAGPLVYMALGGQLPAIQFPVSSPLGLIAAGLIVGFGTRLGGGCTSGHGVCGVSRLSVRSLVATAAFMFTGFATVYVIRHVMGG
ncbi:MAG: YeeE/YedE family protein [Alphaproteobacteria bacterium]|nr:YeeE/YedE family protein [Alphaproteobacteria bacterium]